VDGGSFFQWFFLVGLSGGQLDAGAAHGRIKQSS
jgi:ABC-type microcin C transport system permease subunit YejB